MCICKPPPAKPRPAEWLLPTPRGRCRSHLLPRTKDATDMKQVQEVFDMHKQEGILGVRTMMCRQHRGVH